jgi:hypothetical protein
VFINTACTVVAVGTGRTAKPARIAAVADTPAAAAAGKQAADKQAAVIIDEHC